MPWRSGSQADYTRKLTAGEAPGNGGGGPVPVDGWTCQGYPTPQVLQTGRASECHRGGIEFFAVLPAPERRGDILSDLAHIPSCDA